MSAEQGSRDAIRAKIFAAKPLKREEMVLFGAKVEIRQPTLGVILEAQQKGDRKEALLDLLMDYCFVPGTDDKVFEPADVEGLKKLPMQSDITRLNEVIARLTDIDITGATKN